MDSVLYFPFIQVPESEWLTRILLYWERVGTITPYEFMLEPEQFGPHTQTLMEEGLVEPILPEAYIFGLPGFEDHFIGHLESVASQLDDRRERFMRGVEAPVHLEKLGNLRRSLTALRLAREEGHWLQVETETAEEFMSYLAMVLGQMPGVSALPVTDRQLGISRLSEVDIRDPRARMSALRTTVLEEVFPSPIRPLSASEIARFKGRYGDLLRRFRLEVEREVIRLSAMEDDLLRREAASNLSERIQEDARGIEEALKNGGFAGVSRSKWLAVLGSLPVVGPPISLLTSVSALFENSGRQVVGPFAYAGYVKQELLGS